MPKIEAQRLGWISPSPAGKEQDTLDPVERAQQVAFNNDI